MRWTAVNLAPEKGGCSKFIYTLIRCERQLLAMDSSGLVIIYRPRISQLSTCLPPYSSIFRFRRRVFLIHTGGCFEGTLVFQDCRSVWNQATDDSCQKLVFLVRNKCPNDKRNCMSTSSTSLDLGNFSDHSEEQLHLDISSYGVLQRSCSSPSQTQEFDQ